MKSYKKQIEEAEEIAALNLAKYRKVAGALGDAEASADANEQVKRLLRKRFQFWQFLAGNGYEEGPRQVRFPRSLNWNSRAIFLMTTAANDQWACSIHYTL